VLSKAFGTRTVHTYHSPIEKPEKQLEVLSPKADALVFVSEEAQALYQSLIKIENDRIEIIPGVIDHTRYRPHKNDEVKGIKNELAEQFGKKHTGPNMILFVGRVVEDKGVLPLVKSMKIVKKEVPEANLIIVGPYKHGPEETQYFDKINSFITSNKLEDIILFTGPGTPELTMKLYAASRVVACPSIQEASGIVPIEAMASGKPVIASRVGGLQFRIIDGKTGLLVKKDNYVDLAEKIIRLLKNRKLQLKMGHDARQHVINNYSMDVMITDYQKLYDTIIK
jgi:glycosyltransferase involved in cell wall biosynthesis